MFGLDNAHRRASYPACAAMDGWRLGPDGTIYQPITPETVMTKSVPMPANPFEGVPIGAPIGFCVVVLVFAVVLLRGRRRPGGDE
jgi:hypothetical protein